MHSSNCLSSTAIKNQIDAEQPVYIRGDRYTNNDKENGEWVAGHAVALMGYMRMDLTLNKKVYGIYYMNPQINSPNDEYMFSTYIPGGSNNTFRRFNSSDVYYWNGSITLS